MTTSEAVISTVANAYNIEPRLLTIKNPNTGRTTQRPRTSHPRQVCLYILVDVYGYSLNEAGRCFGHLHHTTVLYACQKIRRIVRLNPEARAAIEVLVTALKIAKPAAAGQQWPSGTLLLPRPAPPEANG